MTLRRALMGSVTVSAMLATPAFAQIEDEIIVTATKREQTLQEVPVAVTVTPAETIERAQILDIADLQSVVPSLRVSQNQNSQQTTFEIRGFGNGGNNVGIEPAVGVFIDGVYRSRAAAQIGDLPKLERIEVLRGPQSTLFGKNSSAGVISIVTAAPSFENEGYVEAGIANYNGVNGRAYLSGPINDTIAASLGGSFTKRDGYAEPFLDGLEDVNDRDRWNVRGQVMAEPSDSVTLRVIGDYSRIDEICCHVAPLIEGPTAGLVRALGGELGNSNDPFAYIDYSDADAVNEIEDYGLSFHVNADVSDAVEVVSISSYRRSDAFYDSEVDYNTLSVTDSVAVDTKIDTFTQELRLQGSGERFDWLAGGYLFYEDIEGSSQIANGDDFRPYLLTLTGLSLGAPPAQALATGEATIQSIEQGLGLPVGTFFPAQLNTREEYEQSNTSFSIFGNVDYDITDALTFTVGASYIDDAKDVTFAQTINNELFSQLNLAGADAAQVFTAGGFQAAFPAAFMNTFMLDFTPANVALVTSTPQGAAGFQALQAGVLSAVQAQVGAAAAAGVLLQPCEPGQSFPQCNQLLGLSALQFLPPVVGYPNAVESGQTRDDDITYTLRLAYDITPSLNIYGAYSTGFKASSFNLSRDARPTPADFQALDAAGLLPDQTAIAITRAQLAAGQGFGNYTGTRFAGPEESEVFEVGVKGRLGFLGGGNFAVTAFQQSIDGFQTNIFQGTGFVLNNAGEQRTRGLEWEFSTRPVTGLSLGFSGRYLDAEYVDFVGAAGVNGPVDASGETVDGISPLALILQAEYEFDLGNNMGAFVRGDYLFESETDLVGNVPGEDGNNVVQGLPGLTREVSSFNFAAGLGFDNGVSIEGWVRNAFGDEFLQSAFPGVVQTGTFYGYPNQPRTYGVNLRYDF